MKRTFTRALVECLLGVACAISLSYSLVLHADTDLWGHLRFGIDQIHGGYLPRHDIYSYAARGRPWIDHEWLSERVFGQFYLRGGAAGLLWLRTLIDLSALAAVSRLLWMRWPNPAFIAALLAVLWPVISPFVNLRPHCFTYLFTALFLIFLEEFRRGHRKAVALMPPLMVLWANLHGGFVYGLGLAAVGLASLFFGLEPAPAPLDAVGKRILAVVLLLTCGAPLLNPYGLRLISFLWMALTLDRHRIAEWGPPSGFLWWFFLLTTSCSTIMLLWSKGWRRTTQTAMFAATALAAYEHQRFIGLHALFSALVLTDSAGSLRIRMDREETHSASHISWGRETRRSATATLLGALVGLWLSGPADWTSGVHLPVPEAAALGRPCRFCYPVNAVEFLGNHRLGPRLALPFKWGEYAVWHLFPAYQVSVDGRYETVYDPAYVDAVLDASAEGDINKFLQGGAPDAVLLDCGSPLDRRMSLEPRWSVIYRDGVAAIYVPRERMSSDRREILRSDAERTAAKAASAWFP